MNYKKKKGKILKGKNLKSKNLKSKNLKGGACSICRGVGHNKKTCPRRTSTTRRRPTTTRIRPILPRNTTAATKTSTTKKSYFIKDNNLTDIQKRWCRCVLHVLEKQNVDCRIWLGLTKLEKQRTTTPKSCYNPYAVCTKSVGKAGHTSTSCKYNFNNVPATKLLAYFQKNIKKYNKWAKKNNKKIYTDVKNIKVNETIVKNFISWYSKN